METSSSLPDSDAPMCRESLGRPHKNDDAVGIDEAQDDGDACQDDGASNSDSQRDDNSHGACTPTITNLARLQDFYKHPRILDIGQNLVAHFGVNICLISLADSDEKISTVACYGLDYVTLCDVSMVGFSRSKLCKMMAKRGAPVIVEDALESYLHKDPFVTGPSEDAVALGIPASGIRFFVELCLKFSCGKYRGTLCLADQTPKKSFDNDDTKHLKTVGDELIRVLEDIGF
jgi:hypothetical protein